jgi:hypothetical protein
MMRPRTFLFPGQKSELIVVPAIHYRYMFAREINRICSDAETRPGAIAVELGPQTAAAARNWLRELGIGPDGHKRLPIMLGLMKQNRILPSTVKEKALQIQKDAGKDLSELPPEVLYRELGFTGHSMLYLNPADSIIEAIRCSLELNLPLYGVDLEDSTSGDRRLFLIPDPKGEKADLEAYVAQHAVYAARHRDDRVDSRREIVMAARIKTLLRIHRRILFTFGLGHWVCVKRRLEDPSLQPASETGTGEPRQGTFERVVVHPLIAIEHMDPLPAVVKAYEDSRVSPRESGGPNRETGEVDPLLIFESLLNRAYRICFQYKRRKYDSGRRLLDLEFLREFEAYLQNLRLLSHRPLPDLPLALRAAREMMSQDFVKTLSRTLMRFPWALPDEHPECSVLAPSPDLGGAFNLMRCGENGSWHRKHIYLQSEGGDSRHCVPVEIPWGWKRQRNFGQSNSEEGLLHTWIPWEYLISSMSLRAVQTALRKHEERRIEVFEGSILEGVDMKATLRAYAQGKERVFVRDTRKEKVKYVDRTGDGFPVIWILQPGKHRGADWTALYEDCNWMRKYVQDRESFNRVREEKGNKMIALIGYGDLHVNTGASKMNQGIRTDRYYGILIYQPICWARNQFARWAEVTRYRRNPFCQRSFLLGTCFSDLKAGFEKELDIRFREFDWPTTLMLFGIPFGKDVLTVVVPDSYRIHPVVYEKAKKHGLEVCTASLASFNPKEIARLPVNYMVPAAVNDPRCIFPKSIEDAIGESQDDNRDLVPQDWLEFGND